MNAAERISKARARMIYRAPFYGVLSLNLKLERDDSIDTMATDGRRILYSESFVGTLTDDELMGVVAHEVLHCALGHHYRRDTRDPAEWNIACDLAINPELKKAKFVLPKCGLDEKRFHDMSAEEIYAARRREKQDKPKPQNGQGQPGDGGQPGPGQNKAPDPGGCGGIIDAAPMHKPAEVAEVKAQWDSLVSQALAIAAKGEGKIPAGLERIAQDHGRARVNWRESLRRFIDGTTPGDYSFARPSRRSPPGITLPGMLPEGIRELVICVDTSGSIDAAALEAFQAEIQAAFVEGKAEKVTVVYCDAAVNRVETFEAREEVKLTPAGGGGTRFSPAFEYVAENCNPSAIIYFTDLLCSDFGQEPGKPVLWAVWGSESNAKRAVPFGEVLHILV